MPIDNIDFMTFDTLPPAPTPEIEFQLNMLKYVALRPEEFFLMCIQLPADIRLHAKYALRHVWEARFDVKSFGIEEYSENLIAAIRNGEGFPNMNSFSEGDILVVDDFQCIIGKNETMKYFYLNVLKPRIETKRLTVLLSEFDFEDLGFVMRDDLRNLIRLGFHVPQ